MKHTSQKEDCTRALIFLERIRKNAVFLRGWRNAACDTGSLLCAYQTPGIGIIIVATGGQNTCMLTRVFHNCTWPTYSYAFVSETGKKRGERNAIVPSQTRHMRRVVCSIVRTHARTYVNSQNPSNDAYNSGRPVLDTSDRTSLK